MKKVIEFYVNIINKLLDLIVKLCGCDVVEKILNNKIVRKLAPWICLIKIIAIIILIAKFSCKKKSKCSKKK